jgi:hypothetical protein
VLSAKYFKGGGGLGAEVDKAMTTKRLSRERDKQDLCSTAGS